MSNHEVLGIFPAPSLEDCEKAIARAVMRIRSSGVTRDKLAEKLGCSPSTIDSATNEKSLLSFDSIALLAYHYPEQFTFIEALWNCRATEAPTVTEKFERLERQLEELKRDLAA